MPAYPHLTKPPIVEAVFNIFVEARPGLTLGDLGPFAGRVEENFPDAKTIKERQVQISGDDLAVDTQPSTQTGTIYWNVGHDRAVQSRLNGYSFNVVNAYEVWGTHRDQARQWWREYVEVAQPKAVVSCGVRYINRIAIPTGREISDFLRTYPKVPDELSLGFDEYVMKTSFPFGHNRRCVMTQVLPRSSEVQGTLLLDFDVTAELAASPHSQQIWDEFEALRDLKNRCFFESLTPAALEVYR